MVKVILHYLLFFLIFSFSSSFFCSNSKHKYDVYGHIYKCFDLKKNKLRNGPKDLFKSYYYKRGKHENVLQNVEIAHKDYGLKPDEKYKFEVISKIKYMAVNILDFLPLLLRRLVSGGIDQKMVFYFIMNYIYKYKKILRENGINQENYYRWHGDFNLCGLEKNCVYIRFLVFLCSACDSFKKLNRVSKENLEEIYATRKLYNENGEKIDDLGMPLSDDLDLKKRLSRNLFLLGAVRRKKEIDKGYAARQKQNLFKQRKLCLCDSLCFAIKTFIKGVLDNLALLELDANWIDKKIYPGYVLTRNLLIEDKLLFKKTLDELLCYENSYLDLKYSRIDVLANKFEVNFLSFFKKYKRTLPNGVCTYYFFESSVVDRRQLSIFFRTKLSNNFTNLLVFFKKISFFEGDKKVEYQEKLKSKYYSLRDVPTREKQIKCIKYLLEILFNYRESDESLKKCLKIDESLKECLKNSGCIGEELEKALLDNFIDKCTVFIVENILEQMAININKKKKYTSFEKAFNSLLFMRDLENSEKFFSDYKYNELNPEFCFIQKQGEELNKELDEEFDKALDKELDKELDEALGKKLKKVLDEKLKKVLDEKLKKALDEKLKKALDERLKKKLEDSVKKVFEKDHDILMQIEEQAKFESKLFVIRRKKEEMGRAESISLLSFPRKNDYLKTF